MKSIITPMVELDHVRIPTPIPIRTPILIPTVTMTHMITVDMIIKLIVTIMNV